jgi:PIN domain nuclease of toxin-antitoxin system
MRLLLDTHLLLWATARSRRLPKEARTLLEDPRNEVYYSAVSLWEIGIKLSLRRPDFRVDLTMLRSSLSEMGFVELPLTGAHAERLPTLPPVHKDPFDRMLVAQCLTEPLLLVTNDDVLEDYGEVVRVVS